MKFLVTGGAGFFGSQFVSELLKAECPGEIFVLDNFSRAGSLGNIEFLTKSRVNIIPGDIREADLSLPDVDVVVNFSADPSVPGGRVDESFRSKKTINLDGVINLVERTRGAQKFIQISTNRVYSAAELNGLPINKGPSRFVVDGSGPGWCGRAGISEQFSVRGMRSSYGWSKLCAELAIEELAADLGFEFAALRFGLISGQGQFGTENQGVVSYLARSIKNRTPIKWIGYGGEGLQVRDALHVEDACEAVFRAIPMATRSGFLANVGGGPECSFSLRELTKFVADQFGCKDMVIERDGTTRYGDIPWYVSDSSFFSGATGWAPRHSLEDIILDSLSVEGRR